MNKPQDLMKRFMKKVNKSEGCWLWTGATRGTNKYGTLYANGRMELAHRVSYTLYVSPIPDGKVVMHSCDNPLCVNPAHLSIGSQSDNIKDMHRKRRGCFDLSLEHLDLILTSNLTVKELANLTGASISYLYKVRRNSLLSL